MNSLWEALRSCRPKPMAMDARLQNRTVTEPLWLNLRCSAQVEPLAFRYFHGAHPPGPPSVNLSPLRMVNGAAGNPNTAS